MTPAALLQDLSARGLSVRADGDNLRVSPKSCITPDVREVLLQNKAALLMALRAPVVREEIEAEIRALQPLYSWAPDELKALQAWAAREPDVVRRILEQSTRLALPADVDRLIATCDHLIDELERLTGDAEAAEELRDERRRASVVGLLEARERLREAVRAARVAGQRAA